MYTGTTTNKFVCLEDITGKREEMNVVIFNPRCSKPYNRFVIDREFQNKNVQLTKEQLDTLVSFEFDQLDQFIQYAHSILFKNKK